MHTAIIIRWGMWIRADIFAKRNIKSLRRKRPGEAHFQRKKDSRSMSMSRIRRSRVELEVVVRVVLISIIFCLIRHTRILYLDQKEQDQMEAGFSDVVINDVMEQQYRMLDKLDVKYERIKY